MAKKPLKRDKVVHCLVCRHPKRAYIDRALVRGAPIRAVGKKYGLSSTSVGRHARYHIKALVAGAARRRDQREGQKLLTMEEQYARDGAALDKKIAEAKDASECQGWYVVKLRWYNIGLRYGFLSEWLRQQHGGKGKTKAEEPALPASIERLIDAVVSDD